MDRMVDCKYCMTVGGFGRTTLWRKVKAGEFPEPIEQKKNYVRWAKSQVDGWLKQKIQASQTSAALSPPAASNVLHGHNEHESPASYGQAGHPQHRGESLSHSE